MYEILSMLIRQSAKRVRENKVVTMLDLVPEEEVDKVPSPRVLNSHLLPK